jgi:hypothetical protein
VDAARCNRRSALNHLNGLVSAVQPTRSARELYRPLWARKKECAVTRAKFARVRSQGLVACQGMPRYTKRSRLTAIGILAIGTKMLDCKRLHSTYRRPGACGGRFRLENNDFCSERDA